MPASGSRRPFSRFSWADSTFSEVEWPSRIVEVGRTGKNNRIRTLGVYDLAPAGAGTRVTLTLQTDPATPADRIMESLGGRSWLRRKNRKAMTRLRDIMERGVGRGRRVTVAGG